eukprot:422723-Prymnesium_polylepis.1
MSACTRKRATFQAECSKNCDSNMAAKSDRPNIGSGASTGASRVTRARCAPPTCMRCHAPAAAAGE